VTTGALGAVEFPGVFKIDCNEVASKPCVVLLLLLSDAAVPVNEPGIYCRGCPVVLARTGTIPLQKKNFDQIARLDIAGSPS